MDFLIIGLGGFLGAIGRYGIYQLEKSVSHSHFPMATLVINALGCFLAGFFFSFLLSGENQRSYQLFLMVGFLGSFTTFSTFALETNLLVEKEQMLMGGLNLFLNVTLGFLSIWGGRSLGLWWK